MTNNTIKFTEAHRRLDESVGIDGGWHIRLDGAVHYKEKDYTFTTYVVCNQGKPTTVKSTYTFDANGKSLNQLMVKQLIEKAAVARKYSLN